LGAWLLCRLLDAVLDEYAVPYFENSETDLDDILVPIVRRGVKTIVWIVATIMAMDNAGYDITTVLAGLGVAGMAFALAAKDSLANMFGGFTIFTDKPFGLKDRIKVAGFDGTVNEIGLRSTRLQTLDGRMVTIPNSEISDTPVENVSSEPSRKVVLNLGLTYDMDEANIKRAMEVLHEIADEHKADLEENLSVGFNQFGDFALNVIFVYRITKGSDILGTQTAINLTILQRFAAEGLELAFPTQTILTKPA
jgi:MscS family membrane protein